MKCYINISKHLLPTFAAVASLLVASAPARASLEGGTGGKEQDIVIGPPSAVSSSKCTFPIQGSAWLSAIVAIQDTYASGKTVQTYTIQDTRASEKTIKTYKAITAAIPYDFHILSGEILFVPQALQPLVFKLTGNQGQGVVWSLDGDSTLQKVRRQAEINVLFIKTKKLVDLCQKAQPKQPNQSKNRQAPKPARLLRLEKHS